ncbi:hypothetical protein [Solemya pervernicosa gill symbiont]|uniref:hypothetical protein n=1 Tax=Solemya pervernicosa gill symbiont TaxID=642797 RepID=UPI0009977368|nr:hypothetical protein [Solemya pervernicosa gill symbiont]
MIYWPGLSGTFLFDDFPNLSILSHLDQHDTYNRVVQFTLSGSSGPTGRPISLFSFMLNDNAWPSDPWAFKYTNLMIHLLNGVLIFTFVRKLLITLNQNIVRAELVAMIATAFWLLQPLNISTVLYVIQRMTELSALFNLILLISYLYAREYLARSENRGLILLTVSMMLLVPLSIFSKENGALIFFYLLATEQAVLSQHKYNSLIKFKTWKLAFIVIPALLIIAYLIYYGIKTPATSFNRDFSFQQRLLTESRIMFDYLGRIIVPRLGDGGLFHDDYTISTSLTNPLSTLFSLLAIVCLLFSIFVFRRKAPLYSFAVAWFFSGHLIESTVIPLELYFEHRNYLPMVGPLIAISYYATNFSKSHKYTTSILIVGLLLTSIFSTYQNSKIWGDPLLASQIWASEHPSSIRSRQAAASFAVLNNDYAEAERQLRLGISYNPDDVSLKLQMLLVQCATKTLTSDEIESFKNTIKFAKYSHASTSSLIQLSQLVSKGRCKPLNTNDMVMIYLRAIENPGFQSHKTQHMLYYWLGQTFADQRNLSSAMEALDKAHAFQPVIDIPLLQAIWLSSAGLYDDSLQYISVARKMDNRAKNPLLKHSKRRDIDNLEQLIIKAQQKHNKILQ